jgi:phosphoribosyl 1,2-cyclic phosphate phosphodiesterase
LSGGPVIRARILGCGSSGGVPRADGDWGACDPKNSKNYRLRCSLLVERAESLSALKAGQATRLLIDTSPDLRQQLLNAGSPMLDGVAFTHIHADQSHGIDDVRAIVYRKRARLPAFASPKTARQLAHRFDYIFETPPGSGYPPLLEISAIEAGQTEPVQGAGGLLSFSLFDVEHGGMPCSGVRIGPIAYTPDVNGMNDAAMEAVSGAALWIVDALREKPHPSHAHLAMTLGWIEQVRPTLSVLTNLHVDMDYVALRARLPDGVRPAYDGCSVTLDVESGAVLHADKP